MGKAGRFVKWVLLQGAFAAAVWLGTVGAHEGAENVAVFWTWLVFIVSLGMLSPDIARRVRPQPSPAPFWLASGVRAFILVLMVWHGWYFTALALILALVLLSPSKPTDEAAGGGAGARHG